MGNGSQSFNLFQGMMRLNKNRTKRISSWDQRGLNKDFKSFKPHETGPLAEIEGPGMIHNFYVTMSCDDVFHYRRAILRMFWDDEETPSVEVPIGDFFGVPFSKAAFFQSIVMSVNPGSDLESTDGLNCYFPMPFRKRARIELFNDSDQELMNVWYHINYEEVEAIDPDLGYFHACWRSEQPVKRIEPNERIEDAGELGQGRNLDGRDNYVILDAKGQGNYAGCVLQVNNITGGWYGEGDDMIFIDDDTWPPSIHGTGSEEVFGGGAGPNVTYNTPYCGYHQVESRDFSGRNAMYKFCVNDPVHFQKSIRVTIEHGHANNLGNDYSSTAYWYQAEPHAKLLELPSAVERIPRAPKECLEAADRLRVSTTIFKNIIRKGDLPADVKMPVKRLRQEVVRLIHQHDTEGAAKKTDEYEARVAEIKAKYDS